MILGIIGVLKEELLERIIGSSKSITDWLSSMSNWWKITNVACSEVLKFLR